MATIQIRVDDNIKLCENIRGVTLATLIAL